MATNRLPSLSFSREGILAPLHHSLSFNDDDETPYKKHKVDQPPRPELMHFDTSSQKLPMLPAITELAKGISYPLSMEREQQIPKRTFDSFEGLMNLHEVATRQPRENSKTLPSFFELNTNPTEKTQITLRNTSYSIPTNPSREEIRSTNGAPPRFEMELLADIAQSLRTPYSPMRPSVSSATSRSRPVDINQFEFPHYLPMDLQKSLQTGAVPDTSKNCTKCTKALEPTQKYMFFQGKLLHQQCFTCETCHRPLGSEYLLKDGKPFCEKDYTKLFEDTKNAEIPTNFSFRPLVQPAKYQIANYNIHPPPAMAVDVPLNSNHTVYLHLVEISSKIAINGGFQGGDVRVLRGGQQTIYFTGLKLSKMGPIKNELHMRNSRQLNSDFCIRFKIGPHVVFSEPFKLVSSCSQLPVELRDVVRPTKKSTIQGAPVSGSGFSPEHSSEELHDKETGVAPPLIPSPQHSPSLAASAVSSLDKLRTELNICISHGDSEGAARIAAILAKFPRSVDSKSDSADEK